MVDNELIENWRNMLKPSISSWLLKTNYEGMGEQDKEEFERDFDEILDLALIGLKYKAQLSSESTTSDLISRRAALDAVEKNACNTQRIMDAVNNLPSAQPEPLTDKEQRIFLAAMRREEKVCKQVDGLVRVCHEIKRKVKGALWTI